MIPGSLFVARQGEKQDGVRFARDALQKGAAAVLCERGKEASAEPLLLVDDVRAGFGLAAHALYGHPSRALSVVGVTGTNGKTTVTSLVSQALTALSVPSAKSGTLGFFVGEERVADSLTTPQPDALAKHLALARDRGTEVAALEVSSHALHQSRLSGVRFQVAALTNLTQDHLDYHGTMEAYGAEKARLFRECEPAVSVLNVDDEFGKALADELASVITVSRSQDADVQATSTQFLRTGLSAIVFDRGEKQELRSPLLGRHNLENLLVAWGILRGLGHPPSDIGRGLSFAMGVPGRLERCDGPEDDVVVVVDYAHTPDALSRALACLRELNFPAVTTVFGCGGDRDRRKRAPMGQAAAELSDYIYLTSDNPRTEDPEEILRQIMPGLAQAKHPPQVIVDRRTAIEEAILTAPSGGVVLVAGKGHEDYQIILDQVLPFDDCVEARRALLLRRSGRAR